MYLEAHAVNSHSSVCHIAKISYINPVISHGLRVAAVHSLLKIKWAAAGLQAAYVKGHGI